MDIFGTFQVIDLVAFYPEGPIMSGVEHVGSRNHLFHTLLSVFHVPENVVGQAAGNCAALGHGVTGQEDLFAVDLGQYAHVTLGVTGGLDNGYAVHDLVAFGDRVHFHFPHHFGHPGGHGKVPFIGGTRVIDLRGVHQHSGVGEQVGVLAMVPVHVSQDDDVDIRRLQVFGLQRLDQERTPRRRPGVYEDVVVADPQQGIGGVAE